MANGWIRSVFRTGSIYLVFSVINRAIPFLLIPVLTRYIEPSGYGIISILGIVTAIATPLVGLCGNSVLFQRFHKLDDSNRPLLINACVQVVGICVVVFLLIGALFSSVIDRHLGVDLFWFELAIATAAFGMVTTLATSLFQIKMQATAYGLLQACTAVVNVGLTVLLVVVFPFSWEGRLAAICMTALCMSLVALVVMARSGDLDLSRFNRWGETSTVFRLGSALIPSTIAGGMLAMSDRLFLTSMTTLQTVGVYAVGVSIAQATDILLNSLAQAYLPYVYKHGLSADRRTKVRFVQGVYALVLVSLGTALTVTLVASPVIDLAVGAKYQGAKDVVGWLSLSFAFLSIGTLFQGLILVMERNAATAYVSAITLAVNLIANYLLIGRLGMVGAAMAVALSSFTSMALLIAESARHFSLPWFDRGVFSIRS